MGSKPLPAQAFLHECFDYDPAIGRLVWRSRPVSHFTDAGTSAAHQCALVNSAMAGVMDCIHKPTGYRRVGINRTRYLSHRIVWKMMHGEDPEIIDHLNGNKADNRLSNLRSVCQRENARNRSGFRQEMEGVWKHSQCGWQAHIADDDGRVLTKYAMTPQPLIAWRKQMEKELGYRWHNAG